MHKYAEDIFQCKLNYEGSILSWLSSMNNIDKKDQLIINTSTLEDGNSNLYSYANIHCDKANNFNYDISIIFYLNSNFNGGKFIFIDEDKYYSIDPIAGRIILFHSGIENIHQVTPVLSGYRYAISLWLSYNKS